ncbi:Ligand binding domain of hormone receptors protein [Tyrophagus putrescentiae]|nr:Ligand binding domain of hormone receptors protein [Tyrophagus putrescentiae]
MDKNLVANRSRATAAAAAAAAAASSSSAGIIPTSSTPASNRMALPSCSSSSSNSSPPPLSSVLPVNATPTSKVASPSLLPPVTSPFITTSNTNSNTNTRSPSTSTTPITTTTPNSSSNSPSSPFSSSRLYHQISPNDVLLYNLLTAKEDTDREVAKTTAALDEEKQQQQFKQEQQQQYYSMYSMAQQQQQQQTPQPRPPPPPPPHPPPLVSSSSVISFAGSRDPHHHHQQQPSSSFLNPSKPPGGDHQQQSSSSSSTTNQPPLPPPFKPDPFYAPLHMRAAAAATGAAPAPLQPLPHQLQAPYDAHCLEIIKKVTAIFSEPPPGGINVVGFVDDLADAFNKQEFQIQNLIDLTKCIEGFQALSSADQLVLFKATFPEILFLRSAYFFNFEKNAFLMRINHNLESAAYVKLETLYGQSMEQHRIHRKLAFMVRDEVEQDLILRDLVCVLLMFKPNSNVAHPEFLKYQYSMYSQLLRRYLAAKYAGTPKKALDKFVKLSKMVAKIGPMKNDLLPAVTRSVEASQVSHVLNEIYYLRSLSPGHQATCTVLVDQF